MSASITKCLFPVAGLGTRFLPATKEIAKEMLPLVDRPIIEYGVDEAVGSGCREMVMITGRSKKAIEDHFDRSFELEELLKSRNKESLYNEVVSRSTRADFIYLRQHRPLGLGHAVLCGEPVCRNEYFGVILPDDVMVAETPVLSQLVEVHKAGRVRAGARGGTGGGHRPVRIVVASAGMESSRSGTWWRNPALRAPSRLAIMGRYILSPEIFPSSRPGTGAGGEIQLTDGIRAIIGAEPVWGCCTGAGASTAAHRSVGLTPTSAWPWSTRLSGR